MTNTNSTCMYCLSDEVHQFTV